MFGERKLNRCQQTAIFMDMYFPDLRSDPIHSTTKLNNFPEIIYLENTYSRRSVMRDPDFMYIFTDNNERTSAPTAMEENVDKTSWYYKKYKPLTDKPIHYGSLSNPTSAIIRGLNNAYPISTMSAYGTNWMPDEFDLFVCVINDEIEQIKKDAIKFRGIKLMKYKIGQGGRFARLPLRFQSYLDARLKDIEIDNK